MDKVDVSIIIINYKTAHLLDDCLLSIQQKTRNVSYEAIVIDNSDDNSAFAEAQAVVQKYSFAKWVNSGGNVGVSKANNLGARKSRGDFLFLLNSDTKLVTDAISDLFIFIKSHPGVGAVGPNLYNMDMKPTHSFVRKTNNRKQIDSYSLFSSLFHHLFKNNDEFNYSNRPMEINGYICGAALLISKSLFNFVGMEDDRIFMYGDDDLLCKKLRGFGYGLFNIPSAKIIHAEGQSDTAVWSNFKIENYVNGNFICQLVAYGRKEAVQTMFSLGKKCKKIALISFFLNRKNNYRNYLSLSSAFKKKGIEERELQ